jgi:hypothetical protein
VKDSLEGLINSHKSLLQYCTDLVDFWQDNKYINITATVKRPLSQNRAIRECYKQIRQNNEGWTAKYTERYCKLTYGVPILSDNEIDSFVFDRVFRGMSWEQKIQTMDCFAITSKMTASQAIMMIEQIMEDHPYVTLEKNKKGRYL